MGEMHAIMILSLHPADVTGPNSFKLEDGGKIFSSYNIAWRENSEDSNVNTPRCENLEACVCFVCFNKKTTKLNP